MPKKDQRKTIRRVTSRKTVRGQRYNVSENGKVKTSLSKFPKHRSVETDLEDER